MEPCRSDNPFDGPADEQVSRPAREARRAYAKALAEALRRPPLRIRSHYEPQDRIDAYPTIELTPCSAATALLALDRVTRGSATMVMVEGGQLLEPGESTLCHADRELLAESVIGASITTDTTGALGIARATDRRLTIARIDGPVDVSDTTALERAMACGATPLDADLRATAVLQVGGECARWMPIWAQFRDAAVARRFTARMLLLYVARVTGRSPASLPTIDSESCRWPTAGFTVRPRDIRTEGVTIVVPLRSATGRVTVTLTLDRTTERWYA